MKLTGIGLWTADVYLLMILLRPDIWPCGDIALANAMRVAKHLESRPDNDRQLEIAERWRPYRAVAARCLWRYYLSGYVTRK
jgi:DNA-3-methyladenine glycosylase II